MHLGLFACIMKLGAKRAELVQKFVPRNRGGLFRNERTRSIPVDPKLMFWYVSYYLGASRTVWLCYKLSAKRDALVQKFVPRSRIRIFRNEGTRSTPLDPKLMFFLRFVLFGCIWDSLVALQNLVQNWPN